MKILIEIKNGIIANCFSNAKDCQLQLLDYNNQKEVPDFSEYEAEHLSIKELKEYIEESLDNNY